MVHRPAPWSTPSTRSHPASASFGGGGGGGAPPGGAHPADAPPASVPPIGAASAGADGQHSIPVEERLQRCIDDNIGVLEDGCCPFSKKVGLCTLRRLAPLKSGSREYDAELYAFVKRIPQCVATRLACGVFCQAELSRSVV